MVEGWKHMARIASAWAGRDISAEAMRQLSRRDGNLKGRILWFSGRPAIPRNELDQWLAISTSKGRRRRRVRPNVTAMVQQWLGLG